MHDRNRLIPAFLLLLLPPAVCLARTAGGGEEQSVPENVPPTKSTQEAAPPPRRVDLSFEPDAYYTSPDLTIALTTAPIPHIGEKTEKDNVLIRDTWQEFEWKAKDDRKTANRKLSGNFRVGAKLHESPYITDILYFSSGAADWILILKRRRSSTTAVSSTPATWTGRPPARSAITSRWTRNGRSPRDGKATISSSSSGRT